MRAGWRGRRGRPARSRGRVERTRGRGRAPSLQGTAITSSRQRATRQRRGHPSARWRRLGACRRPRRECWHPERIGGRSSQSRSLSSASQESPQRHGWSHEKPLVGLGPGTAIDPTGVIRQAERDREDRFIGRVPSTSASRVRTAKTIAGQVTALALRDAAISAGLRNVAPYTMRHPGTPHTVALGNGWETAWGPGGPLSRCILTPRRGSSRWPRSHDF
jgi:hypothetical protein